MYRRIVSGILLILGCQVIAMAQANLNGVINTYHTITGISAQRNSIKVSSAAGYAIGDKVLIIQMQGAVLDSSNTATYGNITNYNNAGNYEIATICDVRNDSLVFSYRLLNSYTTGPGLQCIKIPRYTDATITGSLTCDAWNGNTGGVLIFEVTGTLTFNAGIDVSGKGFAGGATELSTYACNAFTTNSDYAYPANSGRAAFKGDGIAYRGTDNLKGRGKWANGGGGANDHNSGGGGGSNIAAGGQGGQNNEPGTFNCKGTFPGIGGLALSYSANRLFMGGGGGAGHANNTNNAPGANGGGIVIIIAGTIEGNNQLVNASGLTAPDNFGDGAGAGGAGGAIVVQCDAITSPLKIEANGGNGGNTTQPGQNRCFGPGGGGAGGELYTNQGSFTNLQGTNFGGVAGTVQGSTAACNGQSNGAQDGLKGNIRLNYQLATGTVPFPLAQLPADTSICSGQPYRVGVPSGYLSYLWSDNSTDTAIDITTSGTYSVKISEGLCVSSDTITISLQSGTGVDLGSDTTICNNTPYTLDAGNPGEKYLWSTGATTQTISVTTGGQYWVRVGDDCYAYDTITISQGSLNLDLGPDTSFCQGESATIGASVPNVTYQWSTGDTTPFITVSFSADYSLEIRNATCVAVDTVKVTVHPLPKVELGPDTAICSGAPHRLDAGSEGHKYTWNTGSDSAAITVSTPGTYWVKVENTCTNYDTITIEFDTLTVDIGPDTVICDGGEILLTSKTQAGVKYYWQDGSGSPTFTATSPGIHWLQVTTGVCTATDSVLVDTASSPIVDLGPDSTMCEDTLTVLDAGIPGAKYLWSDSSTTQTIEVNKSGNYWVKVTDSTKCFGFDTVKITVDFVPQVFLGNDTIMCPNDTFLLSAGFPFFKKLWSTGDTGMSIRVGDPAEYWVEVYNGTCTAFSAINLKPCLEQVFIPDAFTPNIDSHNDIFFVMMPEDMRATLTIFNRWGQIIYETNDPMHKGWDGKHKEIQVPNDMYFYIFQVDYPYRAVQEGSVLLFR